MNYILGVIAGYLYGSIPFAYLMGLLVGRIDLRRHGSGNLGTTNVGRTLGLPAALLNLILDGSKGFLPYYLFTLLSNEKVAILASLSALLGHCFSLFMKGKGGKGVATTYGILTAADLRIALIVGGFQILLLLIIRIMSLTSISAMVLLIPITWIMSSSLPLKLAVLFIAPFVIWLHRENIKRLKNGQEKKLF